MPAPALERQLADAVRTHVRARVPVDLLKDPSVSDIARIEAVLNVAPKAEPEENAKGTLALIERVTLEPGKLTIELNHEAMAIWLAMKPTSIKDEALHFSMPFQFRKRGVETRLVIGTGQTQTRDDTLIRNIAKAHRYYGAIKRGQTFEEIAVTEKLTKRRILQVIDLAFLAPDIVKSIMQGDQPIALTAKWLGRNPLPSDWQEQRRIVASL